MNDRRLIYFSDPMCSWCYGFSTVIEAIRETWGESIPVRLIMGGLRPGTTEPMTATARADVRGHWTHVLEASGQVFGFGAFDQDGFVYDSDPAARAVVLARRAGMDKALDYLRAAHLAFYAQGRDVTSAAVLGDVAAEIGLDRRRFIDELDTDELKQETWRDYATSRGAGVTGFPTLIAGPQPDNTYIALTRGFQRAEDLLPVIARWADA